MKVVLQRVSHASVSVSGMEISKISDGLVALVGVCNDDELEDAKLLANKTAEIRIFSDQNGKMNENVLSIDGEILVVSNFTLCADCKKGRRPSFENAAPPNEASKLYQSYCSYLKQLNISKVECGIFGADMQVELVNDGPVTIVLDSKKI